MAEGVPRLSRGDLRADLERLYRTERHHHLFAYFGEGDTDTVKLTNAADVVVVPVRSELELRAKLPPIQDQESRIAFLVPWTHDLPLDIAGRFARNGRVRRIGKAARLLQLFGVGELADEVRRSPLVEYLLRPGAEGRYPVGDGILTAHAMWDAWLGRDWGVPTDGGLALDALMAWAAVDQRGPQFRAAMDAEPAVGVREALLDHLRSRLGEAGPVLWRMWEAGKGSVALEVAALLEVLAPDLRQDIAMWVDVLVQRELGVRDEGTTSRVARGLGASASGAFRLLEKDADPSFVRGLLRRADERAQHSVVREAVATSTRLPSAWTARLDALGQSLAEGASEPTADALVRATAQLRDLQSHAFFQDGEQREVLQRAEMAVRLLAWLVARPDQRLHIGPSPHSDAEALGRWYAEEGGYVDWARRMARGSAQTAFLRGVQAVVRAADEARTVLDRRFAQGLAAWVQAEQPSHQVVPIQDAVRRIATRFLEGHEERRLLVLLLDGMAWAQAVQLLESMADRAAFWAPLAWHGMREGRVGDGGYPAVFAALPTTTEVSRAAFFAGKLMKPGARLDTSNDPKHWEAHAQVKRYAHGRDVPRLLLRSEGHAKDGSASSEALSLVADDKRRVVAVVVNAIDDSLKASHAVRHRWGVENIASLGALLDQARRCGRAVLLASDHGHIPADRIERVRAPHPGAGAVGGGARWRPWPSENAPVADNEIALAGSRVYVPKGAHGVVLLTDDASAYAGNTHAGEHGGATLAEVVAPCLLVGCEETPSDFAADPALDLLVRQVPRWWHYDASHEVIAVAPENQPSAKTPPPAPVQEKQLGLLERIEPAAPSPAPTRTLSAFGSSLVLDAQAQSAERRLEVIRAVEVLLARNGVMSLDAFAAEMSYHSFRVHGLVAKLQETLNVDGYQVLRLEAEAKQVQLDVEKLAQLFEVDL